LNKEGWCQIFNSEEKMVNEVFYQTYHLVIFILRPFDFSTERAYSQFKI